MVRKVTWEQLSRRAKKQNARRDNMMGFMQQSIPPQATLTPSSTSTQVDADAAPTPDDDLSSTVSEEVMGNEERCEDDSLVDVEEEDDEDEDDDVFLEVEDGRQEENDNLTSKEIYNNVDLNPTYVGLAKIHQMAMKSGVSLSFVDDLFRVVKSHPGFDVNGCPSRETYFKHIRAVDLHNGGKQVTATRVSVDNGTTNFPKFSILHQIQDLIQSSLFQNVCNLAISSQDDPLTIFQKYKCDSEGTNLEVHSAGWYSKTYDTLVQDTENDWLFPLIFYIDKTGTDANQRFPLEPLMVTTSLLKMSARENSEAWRHLGFLPTCDDPQASPETAMEYFHRCLSKIIDELVELQRFPPIIEFSIAGVVYKKRLLLPVAFVMGDQMSQDKLCGRKAINAGGAGRIHRGCMCSQLHASTPVNGQCSRVEKKTILKLTTLSTMSEEQMKDIVRLHIPNYASDATVTPQQRKSLKQKQMSMLAHLQRRSKFARNTLERVYSMYPINNAWTDVNFGSNDNGIYRATLDDPMHYCDSGTLHYLTQIAFLSMTTKERQAMEDIIKDYFKDKRSSVKDDFPRGKFTAGFSRTTLLTAGEKTGLVFALNMALGTKAGADLYTQVIYRLQQKYEQVHKQDETSRVHRGDGTWQLGDKHYFGDLRQGSRVMDRTLEGVQQLVREMRRHEVMFLITLNHHGDVMFDDLQIEYLLQSVHAFLPPELLEYPSYPSIEGIYCEAHVLSEHDTEIAQQLFNKLRKVAPAVGQEPPPPCDRLSKKAPPCDRPSKKSKASPCERPSKKAKASPKTKHNPHNLQQPNAPTEAPNFHDSCHPKKLIKKHKLDRSKSGIPGATSAILTDLEGFRFVLMHGLAFHSFVHYFEEIPWQQRGNPNFLHECVQDYIKVYSQSVYRGDDGVDCETPKIHSHFHLAADIMDFGHPMNWEASKGERGLKDWAKLASATAQKQQLCDFTYQTAKRISDCALLSRIQSRFGVPANPKKIQLDMDQKFRKFPHFTVNTASKKVFAIERRRGKATVWNGRKLFHDQVISYLERCEHRSSDTQVVEVWNDGQMKINGTLKCIRASSCFDAKGQFYDWVSIRVVDQNMITSSYPAKLLLLFRDQSSNMCAVVHGCEWQNKIEKRGDTPISSRWSLEFSKKGWPVLRMVRLSEVADILYTIEHTKEKMDGLGINTENSKVRGGCSLDVVQPRYMWANNFTSKE